MNWIGKISGGLLGLLLTRNLIGVAVGVLIGHLFDQSYSGFRDASGAGGFGQLSGRERQRTFFETTFLVMGHLAKADGRVSEEEIRAARGVMHQMQLAPEQVKLAIELFSRGKRPDFPIEEQVAQLKSVCRGQAMLLRTFLEIQMGMALSKGSIHTAERELLWRIAGQLGVGRVELAQLEAVLRARRSFGSGRQPERPGQALDEAYKALGIKSSASDREVKTAYRRLMNQHHPDKLIAKGLPDSMQEMAHERAQEIRSAYELIKKNRGMK